MFIPLGMLAVIVVGVGILWFVSIEINAHKNFEAGSEARLNAIQQVLSPMLGGLRMMKEGKVRVYPHETLFQTISKYFDSSGLEPDCLGYTWEELDELQTRNQNSEKFADTVGRGRGGPEPREHAEPARFRTGLTD